MKIRGLPVQTQFGRLLLILSCAAALVGSPPDGSVVLSHQEMPGVQSDDNPSWFKVFSRDGREGLTADCLPHEDLPSVKEINCEFDRIRFEPPEPGEANFPLSVQEALKADPSLEQEAKTNPQNFQEEFNKKLEAKKREICSSSSKIKNDLEIQIRDPAFGPKRRNYAQQVIAACSDTDPTSVFRHMSDLKRRTCGIKASKFTLRFNKVGKRTWVYQQEGSDPSRTKMVYQLIGDGVHSHGHWTLTEMHIPEDGSKEKFTKTIWSWDYLREYELPCDFISNGNPVPD